MVIHTLASKKGSRLKGIGFGSWLLKDATPKSSF
jgi:hypothetical protein